MTSETGETRRAPGDAARRSGPALEAMFRFIVWLIPTLEKFPRSQKFLLGDRMKATALHVLERLIWVFVSPVRSGAGTAPVKAVAGSRQSVQAP